MAQIHHSMSARCLTDATGDQFVICITRSGKTIFASTPFFDYNRTITERPRTHQEALRAAATYAEFARTEDVYINRAKNTGTTPFDLAMVDWFGRPKVLEVDVDHWSGKIGQIIRVKARDNVMVARVSLVIRNADGQLLETGEAVRSEAGSAWWVYTARSLTPMIPFPIVEATAWDLPGNCDSFAII